MNGNLDIDREMEALRIRKRKLENLLALRNQVSGLERQIMDGMDGKVVEVIASLVCEHFKIELDRLMSRSRRETVVVPRQLVFYLCHELKDISWSEIGRRFGLDHATISYGYQSVCDRVTTDTAFAEKVDSLKDICRSRLDSALKTPEMDTAAGHKNNGGSATNRNPDAPGIRQ